MRELNRPENGSIMNIDPVKQSNFRLVSRQSFKLEVKIKVEERNGLVFQKILNMLKNVLYL